MISFRERLQSPEILIADGAMGTMLFERGVQPGESPERINLERPEILEEIAGLYMQAGAELIQTNTFGASPMKLAGYGLGEKTEEINCRAVQAVRKAVGDRAYIYGSIGPCGKLLEPYGDANPELVYESFLRQIRTLIAEGVDLIIIETMMDVAEACLAVRATRSVSATFPVGATMTFDATPRGFYTMMGTSIEKAAHDLAAAGADCIGSNCGNGIVNMIGIAEEFRKHTTLPVIIQSNAGLPFLREGRSVFPDLPAFMAEKSIALKNAGVKIIGGCCGTTPEHIRAIRSAMK